MWNSYQCNQITGSWFTFSGVFKSRAISKAPTTFVWYSFRTEMRLSMESLNCITKKIDNEISREHQVLKYHSTSFSRFKIVLQYIWIAGNLPHRTLFHGSENRKDSRSSDFKSRCFFLIILNSFAYIKTREASRSMAQINEWTLIDGKNIFVCTNPTSVLFRCE